MFIFDQFKRSDRHLQVISFIVLIGMFVLLGGLWFVQVVSGKQFEQNSQKQSIRTVRIPAIRGKILDRNGIVLAENRPRYNINLHLKELRDQFHYEYTNSVLKEYLRDNPQKAKPKSWLRRFSASIGQLFGMSADTSAAKVSLPLAITSELQQQANYRVVSNITFHITSILQHPVALDAKRFFEHYSRRRFVPFPILQNLSSNQVAVFAEQLSSEPSIELEILPMRFYPHHTLAAHILGYVQRERDDYNYSLPDYVGRTGIEGAFDEKLRGQAGEKRVLINNMNYRQSEEIAAPSEPGEDITLTIDSQIQQAAEASLAGYRGAAIVMNATNGDLLALVSAPTFDPNIFAQGRIPTNELIRLNDGKLKPQLNRSTYGIYPPGSTFKIVTAIACFESGLNPNDQIYCDGSYRTSQHSSMKDPAGPDWYNFERAFYRSSNAYFSSNGVARAGLRKILEVGKRFHLGERTDLFTREEVAGHFPVPDDASLWTQSHSTANLCIGQEVAVTPIQMACLTTAIANGGTLFWPRLVSHAKSPESGTEEMISSPGRVRAKVPLNPKHLELIHHAMVLDTEHPDATGYKAFHQGDSAALKDWRIAGKTGTAEVIRPGVKDKDTWFVSYAPYENPRYVVVVMVESIGSGGGTCAPMARKIYEAIIKREQSLSQKPTLARN